MSQMHFSLMQQGKLFSFPTLTDLKQGDKEIRRILQSGFSIIITIIV
jgi:hypothetical protein